MNPPVAYFTSVDKSGHYLFQGITEGAWYLLFYKMGYVTLTDKIQMLKDDRKTVNVTMDTKIETVASKTSYVKGENITLTLKAMNYGNATKIVDLNVDPAYDFTIEQNGNVVWTYYKEFRTPVRLEECMLSA